jgi:hypothetical protein
MTHPPSYNKDLEKSKKNNYINKIETNEQAPPPQQTNPSTTLPSWVTSNPCLSRLTLSGTPNNQNKVYEIVGGRGEVWYYSKNGTFERKDSDNNTLKGTWKCKSNDKLRVITPSNNRQWNEDTNKWTFYRGYTTCPDSLPLKQWCKNNTIKTVQACLRMPSNLQTGNFGPKTEEYLTSYNQNGKTITIDTIKNVCGDNHPLVTSLAGAGGTSNTGAGGTSNTGAGGTQNTGAGGTSNTGAGGTPSQTKISAEYYNDYEVDEVETSAQTTYDGYSEEEPTQPKSTSSNLNASNRKSSYNRQNLADYGNFLNNQ